MPASLAPRAPDSTGGRPRKRGGVLGWVEGIGNFTTRIVREVGEMVILLALAIAHLFRPPLRARNHLAMMEFIGVGSLFIVVLTGTFTGMVFAAQSMYAFGLFGAEALVGPTVTLALTRELAPVLTGLMVTGRAGSAVATELGTMRVSEQIDALETMAVNPIQFLVTPRIVAGIVMVPILTIVFNIVGVIGCYLVAVVFSGQASGTFIEQTRYFVDAWDILSGVIKGAVFGMLIFLIACHRGYTASGGAKGVGQATTQAVVTASIIIFVVDYLLTVVLYL